MAYTVFVQEDQLSIATAAANIRDALKLARRYEREAEEVLISSEDGQLMTIDELEALVKN